jgi:hypothetical protein
MRMVGSLESLDSSVSLAFLATEPDSVGQLRWAFSSLSFAARRSRVSCAAIEGAKVSGEISALKRSNTTAILLEK